MATQEGEHGSMQNSPRTQGFLERERSINQAPCTKFFKWIFTMFLFVAGIAGGITSQATLLVLENASTLDYAGSSCPMLSDKENRTEHSDHVKFMVTLMIMSSLVLPEILTLLYSLKKLAGKQDESYQWDNWLVYTVEILIEMLHAFGSTVLVLKVIPYISATLTTAMCPFVAVVPSIFYAVTRWRTAGNITKGWILLPVLFLAGLGLLLWRIYDENQEKENAWKLMLWTFCGLVCSSLRHFGNFSDHEYHKILHDSRFKNAAIYSSIRIIIFAGGCILNTYIEKNNFIVEEKNGTEIDFGMAEIDPECRRLVKDLWMVAVTHCLSVLGIYFFTKISCQTRVQVVAFTVPLLLITPAMTALTTVYAIHGASNNISLMDFYFKSGNHPDPIYNFIGWRSSIDLPASKISLNMVCSTIGLLGIAFLTSDLWKGVNNVIPGTKELFVKPIYAGILMVHELMLNRRREIPDSAQRSQRSYSCFDGYEEKDAYIFVCATMWHESENEMRHFLKSITRMEKNSDKFKDDNTDFEVHIVFDDAIGNDGQYNEHVRRLISVIKSLQSSNVEIKHFHSPYGKKFTVKLDNQMPNAKEMHVHLKNTKLIRQGKRWSQCMYMKYILHQSVREEKNVFILATDGDVEFHPEALSYVLDRMRRKKNVGAACGRIHPKGSGPVVWFQKFEYASSHWFQKSAEHVLGCVLCTPGCFSLYRLDALEEGVLEKYSMEACTAMEKLQYDQGEDRWLCTLLLKQGWKIEYAAVSDSNTFAPDTFKEFYNQRRRWIPSTIANLLDVLKNACEIRKGNESVSWWYIAYQILFFITSLLGPSTVILLTLSVYQHLFNLSLPVSIFIALIPVLVFIAFCILSGPRMQIQAARCLTFPYALLMILAFIFMCLQFKDSVLPSAVMSFAPLAAIYLISVFLHPTEFKCVVYGAIYYISVPSAFVLLMIYSVANMDNVSWGTRETSEVQQTVRTQEMQLEERQNIRDLEDEENLIWKNITGDLTPRQVDTEKEATIKQELKKRRNWAATIYFVINCFWFILCVMLAQELNELQITITVHETTVTIEPMSIFFLAPYIVILLIQFLSMLCHRWISFVHVMARTRLCEAACTNREDNHTGQQEHDNPVCSVEDEASTSNIANPQTPVRNEASKFNIDGPKAEDASEA